ncbi:putative pentatricopeptide repeat-containing protein At1g53330 [Phragmites australis]|uniref:putative pentatricopeptide repeat-containing protein At1g53330 n=1 Tax=Phragmites australis TaxID=29695 RepID=UPI002D7651CF|nr:putative pentatricopeptide repeat-containing protein At1g53330 [Phragmites australis]XP_062181679.1 putative pentatricopeptide repeat-containing protein At1g53330 [Phragmites australis]
MLAKKFSSYHLAAALRREPDPAAALRLFLSPPTDATPSAPFRYSLRCYDLIISKLAAARLFPAMESILSRLPAAAPNIRPREQLLCRVISAYGRARLPAAARRAFAHPAFAAPRTARALNVLLHALLACRAPLRELLAVCRDAAIPPDVCTYNILMRAAAASGSLEHARHLFDEMLRRGSAPTVVTFGTIIAAMCEAGQLEEAFEVKEAMVRRFDVMPNAHVYASLMKGLCGRGDIDAAVRLKEEMVGNAEVKLDSAVYATLVRALFRVGRKGEVVGLLEEMKERGIVADRVVYNAMIAGFCEDEKDPNSAFAVLDDMQKRGCKADAVSYNTLVAGLCKLARWQDASELVEDMPRRGCPPDVVTYRMLFDGMCAAREFHEADKVLDEMVFKGFAPSKDGARKFVQGIEREGDAVLLESVLCRLAKVKALEPSGWEKAVGGVLHDPTVLRIEKLLDSLRFA